MSARLLAAKNTGWVKEMTSVADGKTFAVAALFLETLAGDKKIS
jgi:hypothetical protein